MGWLILVLILFVFGPVLILIIGSWIEDARLPEWRSSTSSNYTTSTTSSGSSTNSRQRMMEAEREHQSLWLCYARFAGAVQDIRKDGDWRSPVQHASISVTKLDNNYYNVQSSYDHDASIQVERALRMHGDLNWLGMRVVEDGFLYVVSRVKGEDYLYSEKAIISDFLKENPDAYVERSSVMENTIYVTFKFR